MPAERRHGGWDATVRSKRSGRSEQWHWGSRSSGAGSSGSRSRRVRFPLAAAYRGLGQARQVQRLYQAQGRSDGRDAWWACAQAELRLADPKGRPLKPLLECVRAEARPHLDGRLDDPVWQKAKPAPLRSAQADDGGWPAVVMLAYDAEFLYLAVDCRQPPGKAGAVGVGRVACRLPHRGRDADLSAHDRVEVLAGHRPRFRHVLSPGGGSPRVDVRPLLGRRHVGPHLVRRRQAGRGDGRPRRRSR